MLKPKIVTINNDNLEQKIGRTVLLYRILTLLFLLCVIAFFIAAGSGRSVIAITAAVLAIWSLLWSNHYQVVVLLLVNRLELRRRE